MDSGSQSTNDMSREYLVVYTVNGRGYTSTEPWVDTQTEDLAWARQRQSSLLEWFKTSAHQEYDIWIQSRLIGPWERVDLDSLTC